MSLLSLKNASISFGGDPLLNNVTLNIEEGEHICLVGRNGAGKSTLLKILSGELTPDKGELIRKDGIRILSLPQDVPQDITGYVRDIVGDTPEANAAITRLKLNKDDHFESLSGGLKRRALLARALAHNPDILVLDEPTNHLDIDSITWLESYLKSRIKTFVFVTHDRTFLRHMAGKIIDLDRGMLNGWNCDYDTFLARKEQVLADERVRDERLGKLLEKEEAWLRRGVKARTTRNEGRVQALMRLREEYAQRRQDVGETTFTISTSSRSGERALRIKNLTFSYGDNPPLIRNLSIDILRGERIGIIGKNGTGKSTLIRLIMGELTPNEGEIIPGANLSITYFDQLRTHLDGEQSVADNVSDGNEMVNVQGQMRHIYSYLADFLFSKERARTPVKALSGGEKNRLLLARHFLNPGNLLVLDEPTNDLDMETLELLEDRLSDFGGTIILVSHDRTFLNNIVTSTLVFEDDGTIKRYAGGYDDYKAHAPKPQEVTTPKKAPPPPPTRKKRFGFNEKREYEQLPQKIEALEQEEAQINATLSDPEIYKKPPSEILALNTRLSQIPHEIELLLTRWAELDELKG